MTTNKKRRRQKVFSKCANYKNKLYFFVNQPLGPVGGGNGTWLQQILLWGPKPYFSIKFDETWYGTFIWHFLKEKMVANWWRISRQPFFFNFWAIWSLFAKTNFKTKSAKRLRKKSRFTNWWHIIAINLRWLSFPLKNVK